MSAHPLVVAHVAQTGIEAQLVHGMLRWEGFSAVIPGSELNDEFAIAQKLSGGLGLQVLVPEPQLEAAQHLIAEWKAAAKLRASEVEQEEEEEGEVESEER